VQCPGAVRRQVAEISIEACPDAVGIVDGQRPRGVRRDEDLPPGDTVILEKQAGCAEVHHAAVILCDGPEL